MMMRAILIDPEKRTINELQFEGGENGYKTIQAALGCDSFTQGAYLNGSIEAGFDVLYVSDDEISEESSPQFWFQVDANREPPSSYPLSGLGFVIGIDREGEECDARIGLDELRRRITFTQRKFRGFETFTGDAALARGAHFVVEAKTPIIDGTEEKKDDEQ